MRGIWHRAAWSPVADALSEARVCTPAPPYLAESRGAGRRRPVQHTGKTERGQPL